MEANKVYESVVHLANNVIKNERLRYELTTNSEFKQLFIKQIDDMLTLEIDFEQTYNDQKWAQVFGKAVVKITKQKQRFAKVDNASINDVYGDYSQLISFITKEFMVGRNELVEDSIKFTEQDILFSAVMTEEIKEKYKEIEKAAKAEEEARMNNASDEATSKAKNNNNDSNQTFSGFAGGPNQDFFNSMPVYPMQNPKFYPYLSKNKFIPILKYILAGLVIFTSLFVIIATIILMTTTINVSGSEYVSAWSNGSKTVWTDIFKDNNITSSMKFSLMYNSSSFSVIGDFILLIIPAIYIIIPAVKKPRSLKEKYRFGIFPIVFVIIFYFSTMMIFATQYANPAMIKNGWIKSNINVLVTSDGYTKNTSAFWDLVMSNYGQRIKTVCLLVDISLAFLVVTSIFAITLLCINPRLDREKIARANMEYQKAVAAAMQGQRYEMDPSLFDDEDLTVKDSIFKKWFNKNKNKDK